MTEIGQFRTQTFPLTFHNKQITSCMSEIWYMWRALLTAPRVIVGPKYNLLEATQEGSLAPV